MPLPSIIVAEYDPLIRNALRVEFSRMDFVVLIATSGAEAEEFAARTIVHLAVLDVALPGFSGFEACARIRRQHGYQDIPIVLTAHQRTPRIDAAAKQASATTVLAKPYSFNDLLNTLAPHLPAEHALMKCPRAAGLGEVAGRAWGQPASLEWQFGNESGLSRNRLMLPIVRGSGVRIPLLRKP